MWHSKELGGKAVFRYIHVHACTLGLNYSIFAATDTPIIVLVESQLSLHYYNPSVHAHRIITVHRVIVHVVRPASLCGFGSLILWISSR